MLHVEDGNLQAAAAELRPLLSHTADALDCIVPMQAAATLLKIYLRQESCAAASGMQSACMGIAGEAGRIASDTKFAEDLTTAEVLSRLLPTRYSSKNDLTEPLIQPCGGCSFADLLDDLQSRFGPPAGEADGPAKAATASVTPCQEWAKLLAGLRFQAAVAAGDLALAQLSLQTYTELATDSEQVTLGLPFLPAPFCCHVHRCTSRLIAPELLHTCKPHVCWCN